MVTTEEKRALLAVPCPWCGAAPGAECHVREHRTDAAKGTRRYTPLTLTTLDGGAHDARWRSALSRPATVITAAVPHPEPVNAGDGRTEPARVPVAVGGDRPW